MSSNERQVAMNEKVGEKDPAHEADANEEEFSEPREFSWYGGKVDESVVREIVRLKREHKL